MYKLRQMRPI